MSNSEKEIINQLQINENELPILIPSGDNWDVIKDSLPQNKNSAIRPSIPIALAASFLIGIIGFNIQFRANDKNELDILIAHSQRLEETLNSKLTYRHSEAFHWSLEKIDRKLTQEQSSLVLKKLWQQRVTLLSKNISDLKLSKIYI